MKIKTPKNGASINSQWYFCSLLYRFQPIGKPAPGNRQRCIACENWHLLQATTRTQARQKANRIATALVSIPMKNADSGESGSWVLMGIKGIWEIKDELEDGVEIAWTKYENITVSRLKKMLKN